MKRQLFLYMFLLTALILLFFVVNSKRDMERMEAKIEKLKTSMEVKTERYQDTISKLAIESMENSKFSLANDSYAIEYLYDEDIDYNELIPLVQDKLIEMNLKKGGNPLIPYPELNGKKMLINSVKMLNHQWVIADFTDGILWGQLLIKVFYEDDNKLTFELSESFLYPKTN